MKVYIDSNVIIDVLQNREPFFNDSYNVIKHGIDGGLETITGASDLANIYYIIRKSLNDPVMAREKIFILSNFVKICNCTPEDIAKALLLFMPDFEDSVVAAAAKREKADFIITRNEADFENSPVPAISPSLFLSRFYAN